MEKELDGVFDQTADLTEFKTSVIDKLDELKSVYVLSSTKNV